MQALIEILAFLVIIGFLTVCCALFKMHKLNSREQEADDKAQEEWCRKNNVNKD